MPEPPTTAPKDPKKILGMPKWVFWALMAAILILAYYLYKRNQTSQNQTANVSPSPGLTAADIGGTPSDTGTAYDTSGGQPVDNSAQIQALSDQLNSSLSDLSSQISGLSAAGVGPNVYGNPPAPVRGTNTGGFSLPSVLKVRIVNPPRQHPRKKKKVHHG